MTITDVECRAAAFVAEYEALCRPGRSAVALPPVRRGASLSPDHLVQCCWCGEPILPGDSAMTVIRDTPPRAQWWSHYDSRPCYGNGPRVGDSGSDA